MAYNKDTGMYEGYIYKIYNDVNDKVYIGQTIRDINYRFAQHKSDAKHQKDFTIYRAMNKYGLSNFHVVEIDKVVNLNKDDLLKELDLKEKYWIEKYDSYTNGYNATLGGGNAINCQKPVDQYDVKGNLICTWESITDAACYYGIRKQSIVACCTGKSKSSVGYVWRYKNDSFDKYLNIQKKSVVQYSLNGEYIAIYESISEASRQVYGDESYATGICYTCSGKMKTSLNYVWRYQGDPFDKYSITRKEQNVFIHKVNCYTLDGIYLNTFESVKEATEHMGLKSRSSIQESCTNHTKHAKNLLWFYADDPDQPDKTKIIN